MRFANENTDDVFRRAAKDFPLNTDGADWNKVAAVLYPDHPPIRKTKSQRKYLWLLLLLPFSIVCNRYFKKRLEYAEEAFLPKQYAGSEANTKALALSSTPAEKKLLLQKGETLTNGRFILSTKQIFLPVRNGNQKNNASLNTGFEKEASNLEERTKGESIATLLPQQTVTLRENEILQRHDVAEGIGETKAKPRLKKFSIGIEAGTNVTTVKMQKAKGPGFDLGFTVGYALSKRLSVQAAVLSAQKNYYTDGKEFNASKIYLPANTKITTVTGSCRMMEIPVALRYNFASLQKSKWFVAAGASSFLMKREEYDYEYFYAASGQSAKRSRTYKNSSKDWLAAAQFSGGYVYDARGKFQVAVEPYVQVPLKGAGFGKLPLTSAGLRLSLVKKLF